MPQRIILFGSQGSSTVFSASAHAQALEDVRACPAAATLLARCHAAFVKDARSLAVHHSIVFADNDTEPCLPESPEDLLCFPSLESKHPIIEGSRLCLFQLLRYLRVNCHNSDRPIFSEIFEIAGFCSGLLPATAVASSNSLEDLFLYGVASFRLSFWIGYQSWLWCHETEDISGPGLECSLLVRCDPAHKELSEILQSDFPRISYAGLVDDDRHTFSGPSKDILAFENWCVSRAALPAKLLRIHGCYHGGHALQCSADKVCQDAITRDIRFPDFQDLKRPLRSPADGSFLASTDFPDQNLLSTVVSLVLVHTFDWVATSARIAGQLNDLALREPQIQLSLDSIGPGSDMLVEGIKKRIDIDSQGIMINDFWLPATNGQVTSSNPNDIAIVGMAVDFPGAPTADQFWSLMQQGQSTVKPIPLSRFDVSKFSANGDDSSGRTMNATQGNFLDDIWGLDLSFFKISPREAKTMDPQQKVLLRTVKTALENAGYVEDSTPSFQRENFGCYVGVATSDYTDNLRNDVDVYYSPGTLRAFLSGKISYHYKFSGPSVVVDTACSSSTVALYQACRALQNGDCSAALAGGVNTITSPDMYLGLDRGHFLNSTGQCKPFDTRADGYSRAEGCGMFVLKRLSDALAENDRIHGIIKSIEINQSGCSRSITQPDSPTQAALLRTVLRKPEIEKDCVDVIEAHGTGTQAGDVGELRSLHSVFSDPHRNRPIMVSSVKGNIGHCEAASGAAGLAKLLLMLRHGKIPMQASLQDINPAVAKFVERELRIPRETMLWGRNSGQPRRAVLNNFGAAGSNAALLLEEYVPPSRPFTKLAQRSGYPFVASARDRKSLLEWLSQLQQWLTAHGKTTCIPDICYTIAARRTAYPQCFTTVCSSMTDLLPQVTTPQRDRIVDSTSTTTTRIQPIFVFSGQGGSYPGMGKELLETSPLFLRIVLRCDDILRRLGFPGVIRYLSADSASLSQLSDKEQLIVSQCACVVLQYSLSKLYMSWNVAPRCIVGHSLGEYAALAIAGVLSLEDCLRITAMRAQAMGIQCEPSTSGMLAVRLQSSDTENMLQESNLETLEVVCINSPKDCVVGGSLKQLEIFAAACSAKDIKTRVLDVPYAFHSAAMDPVLQTIEELAASVCTSRATIPVYSTVLGKALPEDIDMRYFVAHTRQPVQFVNALQAMEAMESLEQAVFIEIGPHPVTTPLVSATLHAKLKSFVSLRKDIPAWKTLSETLIGLSSLTDGIDWRRVFDGSSAKIVDLPGHPFFPARTGVDYVEPPFQAASLSKNLGRFAFGLRELPRTEDSKSSVFETPIGKLGRLITGHRVGGTAMCPASVLSELVLQAACLTTSPAAGHCWVIQTVKFHVPLIYDEQSPDRTIRVSISSKRLPANFAIESAPKHSEQVTLYCEGIANSCLLSDFSAERPRHLAFVKRQRRQFTSDKSESVNFFQSDMLYNSVFARVVEYSPEYRSIRRFYTSADGTEGYGHVKFPIDSAEDFIVAPVVSDTLLHGAGFVANAHADASRIYICGQMDSLVVLPNLDIQAEYTLYCSLLHTTVDTIVADSFLVDANDQLIAWAERIHFQRVRLTSFKSSLERASAQIRDKDSVEQTVSNGTSSKSHPIQHMDAAPAARPYNSNAPDVSSSLMGLVADTCAISESELDPDQSLDALGIDSMILLELSSAITKTIPGGKVDFAALSASSTLGSLIQQVQSSQLLPCEPTPPLTLSNSSTASPLNYHSKHETFETLVSTLASLCGTDRAAIDSSTPLDSLGIDSMMLIELSVALRRELQAHVTVETLSACTDVQAVEDVLDESMAPAPRTPPPTAGIHAKPRLLATSQDDSGRQIKTPCFLFHDGSGFCSMYDRLNLTDRQLWGFSSSTWSSYLQSEGGLAEMARNYAASIEVPNHTGVILSGWSFGGVVALEAAHHLVARGVNVKGIVLIDAPFPVQHVPLPPQVIDYVLNDAPGFANLSQDSRQSLSANFRHHASLLQAYQAPSAKFDASMKAVMLLSQEAINTQQLCGVEYPWLSDKKEHENAAQRWQVFFEHEICIREIPGTHFEPFSDENISALSEAFSWAVEAIDR